MVATNVSYTPLYQGATLPVFAWTFQTDSGAVVPITGATIVLYFYDPATNLQSQGQGTWNITNGAGGQANYTLNSLDTAAPFDGFIVVHITIGTGTYVVDPLPFQVLPLFYLAGQDDSFV